MVYRLDHAEFKLAVKSFVATYNKIFSTMYEWRHQVIREAKSDNVVKSACGRIRWLNHDDKPNAISNFAVQATAADGFKMALIQLHEKLPQYKARLIHSMHDGIIVEVPEEYSTQAMAMVQEIMEGAYAGILEGVSMPVDIKLADAWS